MYKNYPNKKRLPGAGSRLFPTDLLMIGKLILTY